ncbi:hypothetical protein R5O87_03090 [Arthrobacter globiformis]|uniref:hypothetical protein n=1 Tax=Arthrobacter globiformis TaxID=1665 RepID=UPI0039784DCB
MTNGDRKREARRFADERCVDGLLAESGITDDAELRAMLLEMRSLRVTEVPEPSPEVAALMGQSAPADVISLADWPRRNRRKKRAVFTSLAVAASLGIAGGAAAGNDGLRSQAEGTIRAIFSSFTNPLEPTPTTPAPASPAKSPEPAPAVVPSPAGTAAAPAAPAPVSVPTAEPTAGDRPTASTAPRHGRAPQNGGTGSATPRNSGKPTVPGASRGNGSPSRANRSATDGKRGNGNAKGQVRNDGGSRNDRSGQLETLQDAGEPNNGASQGYRR